MSAPFLTVDHVTRRFGGLVAVSDVTFGVTKGELVSIIGPNGAGKTTLFNLLAGQLQPSAGKVLFEGQDISGCRHRGEPSWVSAARSKYRRR